VPNRSYSLSQKLAGAALARQLGAGAAASQLKVDKRTVQRWLKAAPEDGWTLARDLAQARLQEHLATGKVAPSQLATIAGIADRNVRYAQLIARREASREAAAAEAEPSAEERARAAFAALSGELRTWAKQHYVLWVELLHLTRLAGQPEPPELTRTLGWLRDSTAEQRQAEDDAVHAEAKRLTAGWSVIRGTRGQRVRNAAGEDVLVTSNDLSPLYRHLPVLVDSLPTEAIDVTPAPPQLTVEEAQPLTVRDNGRTWRPIE
jgi:hypothetical protein